MNPTLEYYAANARNFFDNTFDKEMTAIYERFLPLLPEKGSLLDAGCGSGRDSRYFLSRGYTVNAFDASKEMAALATDFIGQKVNCLTFDDIDEPKRYDGIWAAASLLHLPYSELIPTFIHLSHSLKTEGIFYASFKYGCLEYVKDGRHFTPLDESLTEALLSEIRHLQLLDIWLTDDLRQERKGEIWLNFLAKKVSNEQH